MANPLGDGKSGAAGNGAGGGAPAHPPFADRPQKMGASNFNPDSVPAGGRSPFPSADPKGNRGGLLSDVGKPGAGGRKPFKLTGDGPSMPAENSDDDQPVGDVDGD